MHPENDYIAQPPPSCSSQTTKWPWRVKVEKCCCCCCFTWCGHMHMQMWIPRPWGSARPVRKPSGSHRHPVLEAHREGGRGENPPIHNFGLQRPGNRSILWGISIFSCWNQGFLHILEKRGQMGFHSRSSFYYADSFRNHLFHFGEREGKRMREMTLNIKWCDEYVYSYVLFLKRWPF